MRTWTAKLVGNWNSDHVVNVAAETFFDAIKKIKVVMRKRGHKRPRFCSVTQVSKLDA